MGKVNISKSLISSYLSCPYKVYLNKIAGAKSVSSPAMEMGTNLHAVFQNFYGAKKECMSIENVLKITEKLNSVEVEHFENFLNFNKRKKETVKEEDFLPIALEKEIVVHYSSKFNLKGFIDRVDSVDNKIFVTDYKTGKWIGTPDDYKTEMEFYAELLLRDTGVETNRANIYFSKTDFFMNIPLKEEYFENTIEPIIADMEKSFDNNDFPKTYDKCHWCNYSKHCKESCEPCFLKK